MVWVLLLKIFDTSLFRRANPVITHDGQGQGSTLKRSPDTRNRLRFLIRARATGLPRENLLEAIRSVAKALGVDPRNPKRTSYGALELDIFSNSRADFDLFVSAVTPLAEFEFVKDLSAAPPFKEERALFEEARALFNAERYWECHEVLEGIWRQKRGEEKRLLQGIILVCAAFVHHQKGEQQVALGVLKRASRQLDYPAAEYGGFDVARLGREVEKMLVDKRITDFRI